MTGETSSEGSNPSLSVGLVRLQHPTVPNARYARRMLGLRAVAGGCAATCAVVALLPVSGGASASQLPRGCPGRGQRVIVARSSQVVVTRITSTGSGGVRQRLWCAGWLSTGRTTKLGDGYGGTTPANCGRGCAFAAQVQIAGRYVAYIDRSLDHYSMGVDSISEFDARSGTMVVNANADGSLYDTQLCIVKLVLNSRGDVAWLINNGPGLGCDASTGVYEHRPGQPTLALATASPGPIGQLAITDSTVSWLDDGVPHSVDS